VPSVTTFVPVAPLPATAGALKENVPFAPVSEIDVMVTVPLQPR